MKKFTNIVHLEKTEKSKIMTIMMNARPRKITLGKIANGAKFFAKTSPFLGQQRGNCVGYSKS